MPVSQQATELVRQPKTREEPPTLVVVVIAYTILLTMPAVSRLPTEGGISSLPKIGLDVKSLHMHRDS